MSIKLIRDKDLIYNDKEYMEIVEDILSNDIVQEMKNYRQHYNVSCFDHLHHIICILYAKNEI